MTQDFTLELSPEAKTRYVAGPYDQASAIPKYTIEVSIATHVRSQVEVKQFLLQGAGGLTWGWDIRNKSTWPAFIVARKDGVLLHL